MKKAIIIIASTAITLYTIKKRKKMSDKLINVISIIIVLILLGAAYFILDDLKVFLGCLCFLLSEKCLDMIIIAKRINND